MRNTGLLMLGMVAAGAVAWPVFPRVAQFDLVMVSSNSALDSKGRSWVDQNLGQIKMSVSANDGSTRTTTWIDMVENMTYFVINDGVCWEQPLRWFPQPLVVPTYYDIVGQEVVDGKLCDIYAGDSDDPKMWVTVRSPFLFTKVETTLPNGDDITELFLNYNLGPVNPAVFDHPNPRDCRPIGKRTVATSRIIHKSPLGFLHAL